MKTLSSSLGASASIPSRWAAAARRTMPGPASTRYAAPFTITASAGPERSGSALGVPVPSTTREAAGAGGTAGAWVVSAAASAGPPAAGNRRRTSDHDVQQPALHKDHLLRFAGYEPRDRRSLPCGPQRFLL